MMLSAVAATMRSRSARVEVGAFDVLHGGVDDILAVEVAHAHLADGTVEGDVADGEGRSGSQSGQLVGHGVFIAADKGDADLHLGVEVVGEEGTQGTVDQTGDENLMLRGTGLALEETAGEATHGGVFFLIVNGEGHEVDVLAHLFLRADGGQKHCVVHADNGSAVGLFGQLTGLDFDHAAIAEIELFSDNVHCFLLFSITLPQPQGPSPRPIKVLIFKLLSPSSGIKRPAKRKCKDTIIS